MASCSWFGRPHVCSKRSWILQRPTSQPICYCRKHMQARCLPLCINYTEPSICGCQWPPWSCPALLPPYHSPRPYRQWGHPIFARGPEDSHSPTPATLFAAFAVHSASTANAWGRPVPYPPAFTVDIGLEQHIFVMNPKTSHFVHIV